MQKEMLKGYIDAIILSVLSNGDAYGYEITKIVNERTQGLFELKEGTLYPALKRLEANSYIDGYWDEKTTPRRRYYKIGEKGKKKLDESRLSWQQNTSIINMFLGGLSDAKSKTILGTNFAI
ncbi:MULTISPECIES: PadR family transcriptional regulator [unclassified Paenibacillus]|uniref:PadR family transcriptional regulator n=1 Tax=unclassified Paenibacillus TaxID=185978 RepID=UPI0027821D48|nr:MULTISPECIES: helix-turn-helix transcriptional regulator [unclassified Paenibacillus]MDQ0896255.1 PadR family transcriptional regulator PadR [Paenibacillus sp. V4I7]MDQ0913817.1 PadR family transcriptional regulator PadR [Paenibacillus sp. V4I5]